MVTPAMLVRGITITTFSGVTAPNIAEHVLAMMFAFARNLPVLIRQQERHVWREGETAPNLATRGASRTMWPPVFELGGQTLGVSGSGRSGTRSHSEPTGSACA